MIDPVTIGLDPGKTGACAIVATATGDLLGVHDMTDLAHHGIGTWLAEILHGEIVTCAWVELQVGRPGQSSSAMATFLRDYGAILGALGALGVPTRLVTPASWKQHYRLGKDKTASRQTASQLWPASAHLFRRVRDDGRAEAALIAEYGRRQQPTPKEQP